MLGDAMKRNRDVQQINMTSDARYTGVDGARERERKDMIIEGRSRDWNG